MLAARTGQGYSPGMADDKIRCTCTRLAEQPPAVSPMSHHADCEYRTAYEAFCDKVRA